MPEDKKSRLAKFFSGLNRDEARYFLFFFGVFILSWPFLISLNDKTEAYPFYFYFFCWGVILLLLISISFAGDEDEDNQGK